MPQTPWDSCVNRRRTDWNSYAAAVKINGASASTINGGLCFRWEDGDAYDVEITDYH